MRVIYSLALFMMASVSHAGDIGWEKYVGCYNAMELNGQKVTQYAGQLSSLTIGESINFCELDSSKSESLNLNFSFYMADGGAEFWFEGAFTKKGVYTQDASSLHTAFRGTVKSANTGAVYPISQSMDISEVGDSVITVRSYFAFVDNSGNDGKPTINLYKMKKVKCP